MQVPSEPAAAITPPLGSREAVLADLAEILEDNRATYMSLGPEEAVVSAKTPDIFAFGEHIEAHVWMKASAREKAELVLSWITKAAQYYRKPRVRFAPETKQAA